jgi:hypothetical protein
MALRPDRVEHLTDLSFFMNATAERGILVVHSAGGSGAAMDDSNATVAAPSAYDDEPAGLLLNDVVNLDLTRQHLNYHQDEVQQGGKVLLLRRGTVVTDQISGTPVIGEKALFGLDGKLQTESEYLGGTGVGGVGTTLGDPVGRFLSTKDPDGYAKVEINIV